MQFAHADQRQPVQGATGRHVQQAALVLGALVVGLGVGTADDRRAELQPLGEVHRQDDQPAGIAVLLRGDGLGIGCLLYTSPSPRD